MLLHLARKLLFTHYKRLKAKNLMKMGLKHLKKTKFVRHFLRSLKHISHQNMIHDKTKIKKLKNLCLNTFLKIKNTKK